LTPARDKYSTSQYLLVLSVLSHFELVVGLDLFVAACNAAPLKFLYEAFGILIAGHCELDLVLRAEKPKVDHLQGRQNPFKILEEPRVDLLCDVHQNNDIGFFHFALVLMLRTFTGNWRAYHARILSARAVARSGVSY
jgi:hypothetical protein